MEGSNALGTQHIGSSFCPLYHQAVELIGRRWTGAILRAMMAGATRFSDITAAIPALSDRLLSERLKELEQHGIVSRTVIPNTPVRIEYRLTDKGLALSGVVEAISVWAANWLLPDTGVAAAACAGDHGEPADLLLDETSLVSGARR